MEAVINAIQKISFDCDCIVDVVCKNDEKGEVEALRTVGFESYKKLNRMSHVGFLADDTWEKSEDVCYANLDDCLMVYNVLQNNFDPRSEQLPTIKEINDFAKRQQLLVVMDGKELCGFLIFELYGSTSWYLRYWYTSPKYRNHGVGAKLLKTSLVIGKSTKRQQLWVMSDNENAIKRYEHYGFQKEQIYDYVMVKYK